MLRSSVYVHFLILALRQDTEGGEDRYEESLFRHVQQAGAGRAAAGEKEGGNCI